MSGLLWSAVPVVNISPVNVEARLGLHCHVESDVPLDGREGLAVVDQTHPQTVSLPGGLE